MEQGTAGPCTEAVEEALPLLISGYKTPTRVALRRRSCEITPESNFSSRDRKSREKTLGIT